MYFCKKKKEENPMGQGIHPIPSRGMRPSSHPIPWDNLKNEVVPWDGMGWDGIVPSHSEP